MTTGLILSQDTLNLLKAIGERRDRSSVGLARHLGLPPGPSPVKPPPEFRCLTSQLKSRGLIAWIHSGWTLTAKGLGLYLVHFGRRDVISIELGEWVRVGIITRIERTDDRLLMTVTWRQGSSRTPGMFVLEMARVQALDPVEAHSVEVVLDGDGLVATFSPLGSTVANIALAAA